MYTYIACGGMTYPDREIEQRCIWSRTGAFVLLVGPVVAGIATIDREMMYAFDLIIGRQLLCSSESLSCWECYVPIVTIQHLPCLTGGGC